MITVSKQGNADYSTIQEALDSIPPSSTSPITIHIKPGIYKEKLVVDKPHVTFLGDSAENTIITFNDYALMILEDGEKRGTFRTPTVRIDANDFTAKNITFENNSGPGKKVGQALALYVEGDRILFESCRFLASQDTLFTAPLPETAIEKNGFRGPKENAPRINGHHLYRNCYIRGDIDFIFGSATAYFDQCEIFSQNIESEVKGYVTAASTPEGQEYGYVFSKCKFTSNCPDKSVYLGRPWRNFAKTVLLECELGPHIKEEGWHDWNKKEAQATTLYAEYNSFGPGSNKEKRVPWSKQLTKEEASFYDIGKVLGDWVTLI